MPRCTTLLAALLLAAAATRGSAAQGASSTARGAVPAALADSLFRLGLFDDAERAARDALRADPRAYGPALLLGRLLLFSNRMDEAKRWLDVAQQVRPSEKMPKAVLAEIAYRKNNFAEVAALRREIGKGGMDAMLASFGSVRPYDVKWTAPRVDVAMVQVDPLPLLQIRVNGGPPLFFLLDTGGPEVMLDVNLADSLKLTRFGEDTGTFAAGRREATGHSRVDSLQLGTLVVRNVPVVIFPLRRYNAVANGRRVDGIIGTVLLSRFLTTIDYPAHQLTLRPATHGALPPEVTQGASGVPFWLASDHYIVALGKVNDAPPHLLLVDTGLSGLGFTAPLGALREAGVSLPDSIALPDGGVRSTPVTIGTLTFGDIVRHDIRGIAGPFPPTVEYEQGFRIAGLISHTFFKPYAVTFDFEAMRIYLK
jgi:predicted aspartyl protease